MDVDKLKQAAIDAYMRTEGFKVMDDGSYFDYGFGYTSTVDSDGHGIASYSTGEGGSTNADIDYTGSWAAVRTRVDTALEDWQEDRLPDPGALNGGVEKAKQAVTALNIGTDTSLGGALGGYLKTVKDNSPQIRGHAGDAFNNSFVNQIPRAVSNHGCLAALVVEAWSAEEEIWRRARTDRDTQVEQATNALDAYAHTEETSSISFVLALAGAAVAGAAAVATGGVAAPFALATAGITALSATADYATKLEVERSGANYEDLMAAFEGGLSDVDEGITQQEQLVQQALEDAWNVFESSRTLFDLTPRVTDDGDSDWGDETSLYDVQDSAGYEISLPGQTVIDSMVSGLDHVANGVGDAAPIVTTGADDGSLLAPSAREVGLKYNGASIWMWIIGDNNASSLRNLKWDVAEGTRMFQAFVRDFREQDGDSQAALNQVRAQVQGGSGEDPWA